MCVQNISFNATAAAATKHSYLMWYPITEINQIHIYEGDVIIKKYIVGGGARLVYVQKWEKYLLYWAHLVYGLLLYTQGRYMAPQKSYKYSLRS